MGIFEVSKKMSVEMLEVLKKEDEIAADVRQKLGHDVVIDDKEAYRLKRAYWNEHGPQMAQVQDLEIPGPHGKIALRIYKPTLASNLPVILYIHGGGFAVGDNDTHDGIMRHLAHKSRATVVGIAYRLAPEWQFPVPMEEIIAAIQYLQDKGASHDVDYNDISLAGDSAGAHLALGAYLYMRDHQFDMRFIRCLLLFYGQYGLRDSISRRLYADKWDGMAEDDLLHYESLYIANEEQTSPYYDFYRNDLSHGIPPAYLCAGSLDPLADDSRLLHAVLCCHDIENTLQVFGGICHGFLHYTRVLPEAHAALDSASQFFMNSKKT